MLFAGVFVPPVRCLRPARADASSGGGLRVAFVSAAGARGLAACLLAVAVWPTAAAAKHPHASAELDACAASRAGLPSDAELESQGVVVGEIRFRTIDIFDTSLPEENTKLFRLANRLHRTTRPRVIERQLLVKSGDPYTRRRLDESERILRMNDYLFEASICPVAFDGQRVDLEVTTRDVWTLKLGISLGRGGGVNNLKAVVADDNLLGTGKSLTAERLSDVDRTSSLLRYIDPAVLGTRWVAGASYSDNSDGSRWRLFTELPFYALDTRRAGGVDVSDTDRIDSLYNLGEVRRRFRERFKYASGYYGWSQGLRAGWARRWSAGYTYEDHVFTVVRPGGRPPPDGRTLSYPWFALDFVQDAFGTVRNLNQIYRVEDVFLGWRFGGKLGYSDPAFGGGLSSVVFGLHGEGGRAWESGRTLLWDLNGDGRYRRGIAEGMLIAGRVRYYQRDFGDQLLYMTLELAAANRLDAEQQLLIGGDSGLRGYPLRYQSGDRRLLFTIEQRVYTNWYPFRLVRVGGAAFFDVGRAWFIDDQLRPKEFGWLKDVGCGLRLASSRSGFGNVVHVDVAFPFDKPNEVARVQFVVSTQASF